MECIVGRACVHHQLLLYNIYCYCVVLFSTLTEQIKQENLLWKELLQFYYVNIMALKNWRFLGHSAIFLTFIIFTVIILTAISIFLMLPYTGSLYCQYRLLYPIHYSCVCCYACVREAHAHSCMI